MSKFNIKKLDSLQISVLAILVLAIISLVFVVYIYYLRDDSEQQADSTMFELPEGEKDDSKKEEYKRRIDSYNEHKQQPQSELNIDLSKLNDTDTEDSSNVSSAGDTIKPKKQSTKPAPTVTHRTYQQRPQPKPKPEPEPEEKSDSDYFTHERTFRSATRENNTATDNKKDEPQFIKAVVHGEQKVSNNDDLKLRLIEEFTINGTTIPRNTFIWGKVSFYNNRLQVALNTINVGDQRIIANNLTLYDLDGMKGLKVRGGISEDIKKGAVNEGIQQGTQIRTPIITISTDALRKKNREQSVLVPDNHDVLIKK